MGGAARGQGQKAMNRSLPLAGEVEVEFVGISGFRVHRVSATSRIERVIAAPSAHGVGAVVAEELISMDGAGDILAGHPVGV